MDDFVLQRHPLCFSPRGILWLNHVPESYSPSRISFSAEKMQKKNKDKAQSMFAYIREKCAPLHPSIFTADVMNNWTCWYKSQELMFSNPQTYILDLAPFQWPMSYQFSAEETALPEVLPLELPEEPAGTEIIVHQSEEHGAFTKEDRTQRQRQQHLDVVAAENHEVVVGTACIYRWRDDSDSSEAPEY